VSVTNKEVLAYAGFQEVPSAEDLSRCFFLDDQDLSQIARKRGDPNRLGFALQLGTLRYVGLILSDPTDVPPAVIDYVAAEVDAKDPSCVKQYLAIHTVRACRPDHGHARLRRLRNCGTRVDVLDR
jgi:hypothetical protein